MSVISNNQLAGAAGQGGSGPYEIKRSLRFNAGDSANLTKTFSSGNQKTFTLSFWVKGATSPSFYNRLIFTYGSSTASYFDVNITTAGVFQLSDYYTYYIQTSAKFRDPSAWYHFVVSIDTTTRVVSHIPVANSEGGYADFANTNNVYVSGNSTAVATVSSVDSTFPEVEKYSGQIMYVENRGAVSRAADQIEDIKLIIEM